MDFNEFVVETKLLNVVFVKDFTPFIENIILSLIGQRFDVTDGLTEKGKKVKQRYHRSKDLFSFSVVK